MKNKKNFYKWSVKEVSDFIQLIPGCNQFASIFVEQVKIIQNFKFFRKL